MYIKHPMILNRFPMLLVHVASIFTTNSCGDLAPTPIQADSEGPAWLGTQVMVIFEWFGYAINVEVGICILNPELDTCTYYIYIYIYMYVWIYIYVYIYTYS